MNLFTLAVIWFTFFSTIVNAVLLISPSPLASDTANAGSSSKAAAVTASTNQASEQLELALERIAEQKARIQILRTQLDNGDVQSRDIEVTTSNRAYWLVEPKLARGVSDLLGTGLSVQIGHESHFFKVGTRLELSIDEQQCDLTLLESFPGRAQFHFSCSNVAPLKFAEFKN